MCHISYVRRQNVVPEIPFPRWLEPIATTSRFEGVVKVDRLRLWSLSEVCRLTLKDGTNLIAKRASQSMVAELQVYKELIGPLGVPSPQLHDYYKTEQYAVMLFEDVGATTLEQKPSVEGFIQAVRLLARLRAQVSSNLTGLSSESYQRHLVLPEAYVRDLQAIADLMATHFGELDSSRDEVEKALPELLKQLYRYPVTLTHNDYHTKNIVLGNNGVTLVDWSNAYLSSHLGDLYCLVGEAAATIDECDLLGAYCDELEATGQARPTYDELTRQVDIGGLCWSIHALRWIFDEGLTAVSDSYNWVPDQMLSAQSLARKLVHS